MSDRYFVTVAVTITDRTRDENDRYVTYVRTPTVMVEGDEDPTLVACELIYCLVDTIDGMVLGAEVISAVV